MPRQGRDSVVVGAVGAVFAAAMTDRPFTLIVMDTANDCLLLPVVPPACCTRQNTAVLGRNQNFIDLEFPIE